MGGVAEHPTIKGYGADRRGNVINITSGRILKGCVRGGYRRVWIVDRLHSSHVFVWTCFNDAPNKGYEVHHKNADKSDNRVENLDIVQAGDHRRLTAATWVQSGKPMTCPSRRRQVKRVYEDGREEMYSGVEEAARAAGVCASAVTMSAKSTAEKRYKGAFWRYVEVPDEEGEIWACPRSLCYRGLCVSNIGRVKSKYCVVSRGVVNADGYLKVRVNDRGYAVHSIINEVFNGLPLAPGMTTDHVDRDRSNNRADNLRWSTKEGQSHNSSRSKPVTATCVLTGTVKTWPSARLAAKGLGIKGWGGIGRACNSGKEYRKCVWTR